MIRAFRHIGMHIWISCKEKRLNMHGRQIKYILEKNKKAKELLVVFSGFSPNKPRYNYIRTLRQVRNVNKLFILDDFGYHARGSYYLMENGEDYVHRMCLDLIQRTAKELSARKIYCAGSSKGGTAALLYGCELGAEAVVIGAPQYYIGDYLNTVEHKELLDGMLGEADYSELDISGLNQMVAQALEHCKVKPVIYLHYSKREHTYEEHIRFLLEQLYRLGFVVKEDVKEYLRHDEVALFFGDYMCRIVSNFK